MSRGWYVLAAACLLAPAAVAQNKISGSVQCGKPDIQQSAEVGDRAGHSFVVVQVKCTWTKPLDLNGMKDSDGLDTLFEEVSGSRSTAHGYFVDNFIGGDKAHVRYQGTGTMKPGGTGTVQGTWSYVGGTGILKGLKGHGTYKGTVAADGTVAYDVEGEYVLPTKPMK